ncbi:hypothetical protein LCGC14_2055330, partial [marine sediment metagenome]
MKLPLSDESFRPTWATTGDNFIQTISFGDTFPNTIQNSEIVFDSAIESGGNFFINNPNNPNFAKDGTEAENNFIRYYDTTPGKYQANKFSLKGLVIDPNNFYTSNDTNFPIVDLTSDQFVPAIFSEYINSNGEIKLKILSNNQEGPGNLAFLSVGNFQTRTLANTLYLNYDEFELASASEHIKVTDSGLELNGTSGIRTIQETAGLKFNEIFLGNDWQLPDIPVNFNVVDTDALLQETYVRELHPTTNYDLPQYQDELKVRYNYDTNKKYVSDYDLLFGYDAGVNSINDLKFNDDGESLDFNSKYSPQLGLRLLLFDFGYNFNLLEYTEYTFQVEIKADSGTIDMLRIFYYDEDDNSVNKDYYNIGTSFSTIFTINSITSNTNNQRIYFALDDTTSFGVEIDYAWLKPKQDKVYSYMELKDSEYLTNYEDSSKLTFTSNYGVYPTTIEVYKTESYSIPPVWTTRPSMTSFISSNLINQGSIFDLDLNYPRNGFIGLKTLDFGIVFDSGFVTRTDTLSKFYQGLGMVYIQTDTNDQLMKIISPVYTNDITTDYGDKVQIRIQANTDDPVYLKFYDDILGETESIQIIQNGNTNFNEQVIQLPITEGILFDQIGLTVELDDKEFVILHSVSIASAEQQDFELETIISSYSFDSFTYNEETNILNSPKETYSEDEIYWTIE